MYVLKNLIDFASAVKNNASIKYGQKLEFVHRVDAFVEEFGGAGKRLELSWFKDIDCSKFILAGGLSSENLKELNGFNFFAVDVSSAVEKQKGIKDREKMVEFVKAANEII